MHDRTLRLAFLFVILFTLSVTGVRAAPAKTYKITGPVVEMSNEKIVLMKDEERWEINRDATTAIEGIVEPGATVTVTFRMTATAIEGKAAPANGSAKAPNAPKPAPAPSQPDPVPVQQE